MKVSDLTGQPDRATAVRLPPLISRDTEVELVTRFLHGELARRSLVIIGDAGIGKTSLWEAGLAVARQSGCAVLEARGNQAEATLPFAALRDLLERIDPDVLIGLPAPQSRALEVAVRIADPVGTPVDPLAIAAGLLNTLRLVSSRCPVLVAIDDVQWLDDFSQGPLEFSLRRLFSENVRVLLARRPGRTSAIERACRPGDIERIELQGLSLGAVQRLLRERLDIQLSRRECARVHETSRGNPLFALELGLVVADRASHDLDADWPLPQLVEDMFGARIRGLPEETRTAVLAVALSGTLTLAELTEVLGPGGVEDAIFSGLLTAEGSRIRPSHPLLAAAARQQSKAGERRRLHLDLAAITGESTLRARHLALATARPDARLAADIEAAADLALQRGARHEAEELAEQAWRLTPPDAPERADRVITLARRHLDVADTRRVVRLLTAEFPALPPGRYRALAHMLIGQAGDFEEDYRRHELALAEAGDDPEVQVGVLVRQAILLAIGRVERLDEAERKARQALDTARTAAPDTEALVLPALAWVSVMRGREVGEVIPAAASRTQLLDTSVNRPLGVRCAFRGETAQAHAIFESLLASAHRNGEVRMVAVVNFQQCELATRCGDANQARLALQELVTSNDVEELALRSGQIRLRALIGAIVGEPGEVVECANSLRDLREPVEGWDRLDTMRAQGIAALFEDDAGRAVEHLGRVWEHCEREHVDDPGAFPVAGDLVEALAALDSLARAADVTGVLRRLAEEQEHPWGLTTATRCEALVAMAHGRYGEGCIALEEAASQYQAMGLNFDQARCLLSLGRVQRRQRQNRAARRSLTDAADIFERGGCVGWAAKARGELARVSGRRSGEQGGLTPSERQVASLAAAGYTNREIAERLVVSVYTVEAHLTHTFTKLGIRSRAQLAARIAD
jgi:DNA-binding CsgD family transcriptional regulator